MPGWRYSLLTGISRNTSPAGRGERFHSGLPLELPQIPAPEIRNRGLGKAPWPWARPPALRWPQGLFSEEPSSGTPGDSEHSWGLADVGGVFKHLKLSILKRLFRAAQGNNQAAELKMLVFISEDSCAQPLLPLLHFSEAEDEPTILILRKFLMKSKKSARVVILQLQLK